MAGNGDIIPSEEELENMEAKFLERQNRQNIEVRLLRQTFRMRRVTIWLVVIVTLALFYIEYRIFMYLTAKAFQGSDLFLLLAVTPIVAVTAIMIAVLSGLFKAGQKTPAGTLAGLLKDIGRDSG